MFDNYLISLICLGLVVYTVISFIKPATASDGHKSWTLTGLKLVTVFVLATVLLDTLNDRVSITTTTTATTLKATTRNVRPVSSTLAPVRSVIKEKYNILGGLWLGFAILYMLSHRLQAWSNTVIRGIMAVRKMDPFVGQDAIDKFIIAQLDANYDSVYHHEWFLRALLAKRGEASAVTATDTLLKKTGPPSEPQPPGIVPPDTNTGDMH